MLYFSVGLLPTLPALLQNEETKHVNVFQMFERRNARAKVPASSLSFVSGQTRRVQRGLLLQRGRLQRKLVRSAHTEAGCQAGATW